MSALPFCVFKGEKQMSVKIFSVNDNSICNKKGIVGGDVLNKINGNDINDVLDYDFYAGEEELILEIKRQNGKLRLVKIYKDEDEDIGLQFETYLMDKQRHCANKCIFCFIDQLPKGMRKSLYFKDDDSRLSFLFGNYITLTNLKQADVDRIIKMHISPVNVSVHTMNPDLRVKMMKNPNAGKCLDYLKQFADAGIKINAQLVLCPGINDGEELSYSLEELGKLYPAVESIAAVPVGLSDHRKGLFPLKNYEKMTANDVLSRIEVFNSHFLWYNKTIIAYPADEFYIIAGKEIPKAEFYGDYPQLENGVGMWALLKDEFYKALDEIETTDFPERRITAATGEAAYPLIKELSEALNKKCPQININVIKIKNNTFGKNITVSGLLCGKDYYEQLKDIDLGEELLIPGNSLRREGDIFLDDVSVEELSGKLNIKINAVEADGYELLNAMINRRVEE